MQEIHASLCHYCKTLHYFAIMLLHSFEDKLDLSLRKSIIQLLSIFLLFFGAMSSQTKLCIMHGTGILLSQRNSSNITSDKEFLCSSHYLKHWAPERLCMCLAIVHVFSHVFSHCACV